MNSTTEPDTSKSTAQSAVEEQITFILCNPNASAWLRDTLRSALDQDPITILNDIEILSLILRNRSLLLLTESYNLAERLHRGPTA